jgi:UDP-N-acetylglucosamine diphosphorylase/glucosamine-1-phosphate N-acetyltransferase
LSIPIVLFDGKERVRLLPLTFTRPVSHLRVGILTIKERWERLCPNATIYTLSPSYLQEEFTPILPHGEVFMINGSYIPTPQLVETIMVLKQDEALLDKAENLIAFRGEFNVQYTTFDVFLDNAQFSIHQKKYIETAPKINALWDIFSQADRWIRDDFALITKGRTSASISSTNRIVGEEHIFIEEGAKVEFSILNATTGPIYIGKEAEIMENCAIRGPFALGEHAVLKMGAKIYGPTSLGPHCKVGGEVNNSIFIGFSNKAHDGFIGNAVIGEWCNLGADTNNSNLKNTYDMVKLWSYETQSFVSTGLQFCGLIMGDHTKCSINTMFNTGTVVGVGCNLFGDGFHRNFIPSFTWGSPGHYEIYQIEKAFASFEKVKERRNQHLTETEKNMLRHVFELEKNQRR